MNSKSEVVKVKYLHSPVVELIDVIVNEFIEKEINETENTLIGPVSFQIQTMGDGRPHAFALVTYSCKGE